MAMSMYSASFSISVRKSLFTSIVRVSCKPVNMPFSSSWWQEEHRAAKSALPFSLFTTVPDEEDDDEVEEDEDEEDVDEEDDEDEDGYWGGFGLEPPLLHPWRARAPTANSNNARFFKVSLLYAYTYDVSCSFIYCLFTQPKGSGNPVVCRLLLFLHRLFRGHFFLTIFRLRVAKWSEMDYRHFFHRRHIKRPLRKQAMTHTRTSCDGVGINRELNEIMQKN